LFVPAQVQLRRFITIIESMTEKEQDTTNVKMLTEPSRVMRLAKGSGRSPAEIFQLIEVGMSAWYCDAFPGVAS
jgi:signal recognition particle subunit SRP54